MARLDDLQRVERAIVRIGRAGQSRETASLVADGFVSRTPDPTDGRATIVKLTAKGRKAYQKYRDAVDGIVAEAFDGWKATDLKAFADYLERMAGDVTLR